MNNLSIKAKLVVSFTVLLGLMIGLGIYSLYSLGTVNKKTVEITSNWMVGVKVLNEVMDEANVARRYELNHLIMKDEASMNQVEKGIDEAVKGVEKAFADYRELVRVTEYTAESDRQKDLDAIGTVEGFWKSYLASNRETVRLSKAQRQDEGSAVAVGKSREEYAKMEQELAKLIEFNNEGARVASEESGQIYNSNRTTTYIVLGFAVLIGLVIIYFLVTNLRKSILELARVSNAVGKGDLTVTAAVYSRDELGQLSGDYNQMIRNVRALIKQIQDTAEQVAASSQELTASADQSAQVTQQIAQNISSVSSESDHQTAAVESTSAVVQQMSGGIEQAAANANTSAENATQVVDKSKEGEMVVKKAVAQMGSIETTVNNSAAVVTTLGERSKEIGQIVETISGIAGQTNLLALNAAIEAARAGEQGRGFAVVAEEVRKLAEQSQEAAERIATLIQTIQGETEKAVTAMQAGTQEVRVGSEVVSDVGGAFNQLAQMAVDISQQVQDISATMQELSTGAEQIVGSVKDVDRASRSISAESQTVAAATEEQSAAMEQIAASSQNLSKLAQSLQEATQKFTV